MELNTQHALDRGRLCQAFTMPYQLQSPKGRRKLRPATERLAYCRDSHMYRPTMFPGKDRRACVEDARNQTPTGADFLRLGIAEIVLD